MNIAESFAGYLTTSGIATLGQDLLISNAPSTNKRMPGSQLVPNSLWWIVATGGAKTITLQSGESVKEYTIDVYRRDRSYQVVYEALEELEVQLNCDGCVQLDGYDTVDIEARVLSIDNDLDDEDRKVGLLEAVITIFKEC